MPFLKNKTVKDEESTEKRMPTLSVCICIDSSFQGAGSIIDRLKRSLESVKNVAQEIIIVEAKKHGAESESVADGNSIITSALESLAMEYDADYHSCAFEGDLSKVLNIAVRSAGGDFIMALDPDEELDAGSHDKVIRLLDAKHYDVFYTKIVNYDANGDITSFYYRPRIFKNHLEFYFEGEFIPRLVCNDKRRYTQIFINHYGYTLPIEAQRKKVLHNLELFKKQAQREPDNPYIYFYAAEGSELVGDLGVANDCLLKAVEIAGAKIGDAPQLKELLVECYFMLSKVAMDSDKIDAALEYALKGYELEENNVNINYVLAETYYRREDYESAYKHYVAYAQYFEMLENLEVKKEFLIFDSVYYVNYMLGKTAVAIGKGDEAAGYFEKAIQMKPDFAEAYYDLGMVYQQRGDVARAVESYEKALEIDPELAHASCGLGVLVFNDDPERGMELIETAHETAKGDKKISEIYESYKSSKKKVLERSRVSVCINTHDNSRIKDTIQSTINIAEEFVIPHKKDEEMQEKSIKGKRVLLVNIDDDLSISERKNALIKNSNFDWVLFLNEGENIGADDIDKIIKMTKRKEVDLYSLNVVSELGGSDGRFTSCRYEPRLFRRKELSAFDEVVFEDVNATGKREISDVCVHKDNLFTEAATSIKENIIIFND